MHTTFDLQLIKHHKPPESTLVTFVGLFYCCAVPWDDVMGGVSDVAELGTPCVTLGRWALTGISLEVIC
jgi:hypothetical protein